MKLSLVVLVLLFISPVSVTENATASSSNQVITYKCDEAYDKVTVKFENNKVVAIYGIVAEGGKLGIDEVHARTNVTNNRLRVGKNRNIITLAIVVSDNGETQDVRCRRTAGKSSGARSIRHSPPRPPRRRFRRPESNIRNEVQ